MSILTLPAFLVNFDFAAVAPLVKADEYRPTAGQEFTPTAEEEAEAVELLNDDEPEPDWDALAEDSAAMDRVCLGCYAF